MDTEYGFRKEMVEIGRRIYEKDFVASNDGNLSIRLDDNHILITPSGQSLGFLKTTELVIIDHQGQPLLGPAKPTSEYLLHLEVYRQRKDVRAVVHAHPAYCTAFSVAGVTLDQCVLPEVVFTLGAIPTTEYGTPTTEETPRIIRDFIGRCDAIILDRHGTLTVGDNLSHAYFKLEKLEHTAKIILIARTLGKVKVLNEQQVDKLLKIRSEMGLEDGIIQCVHCASIGSPAVEEAEEAKLAKTISSEVLKIIHG